MNNLPCLFSSGIGSTSRVVRFLKLNRHSNSVNNPNGSLNQRVVAQPRSSFVTVRPSHSLAEQQQSSIGYSSTKFTSFSEYSGSKRWFSSIQSRPPRSQSIACSHLLSQFNCVQRSVTRSSSMAPIIVNYESYLDKLISDTRVLIFSKSTCPFCLKVSFPPCIFFC